MGPELPESHLQPVQQSLQSWMAWSASFSSASSPWEKEGVPDSGGSGLQMGYSLWEGDTADSIASSTEFFLISLLPSLNVLEVTLSLP